MTPRRLSILLLAAGALASCSNGSEPPCILPLSPECARAEADLVVHISRLPDQVTGVEVSVGGQTRREDQPGPDRSVTFYYFDLPAEVDVAVALHGTLAGACEAAGVTTGRGRSLSIDTSNGAACTYSQWPQDGGAADAGVPDGGEIDDGGVEDGGADGGDRLLLLTEHVEQVGGSFSTYVAGTGEITLRREDEPVQSAQLGAADLAGLQALALHEDVLEFLAISDDPCNGDDPEHSLRVTTPRVDVERHIQGCDPVALLNVLNELQRLRTEYLQ